MTKPYSPDDLPELFAESTGLTAEPRANTTYACVRATTDVSLRTAWLPQKGVDAGKQPNVRMLTFATDELHMLYDLMGYSGKPLGLDLSFGESGTYEIASRSTAPAGDPRVGMLRGIWAQVGQVPQIMLVRRIMPIHVLGQVAVGHKRSEEFIATDGTVQGLHPHTYIVRGANGVVSAIANKDMRRMFWRLARPDGTIAEVFSSK